MTVVNHVLNRIHVQRLLLAASLLGLSLSANAAFPRVTQAASGKATTLAAGGRSTGGTLLDEIVANTPTSRAGGGVNVGASGRAKVNGNGVPVSVTGNVGKDALAGAVEGAMLGARGGLAGAAAGAAIGAALPYAIDWAKNSGVSFNADTGKFEVPDADPSWPVSDGYQWRHQLTGWTWKTTREESCIEAAALSENSLYRFEYSSYSTTGGAGFGYCFAVPVRKATGVKEASTGITTLVKGSPSDCPLTWYKTPAGCVSPANLPRIVIAGQQLVNKLNTSTAVPNPNIVNELDNAGAPLTVKDPTVTGPASVAGPGTTTINNIDNSVSTKTTTNNYTYNGPTITNTSTTTTTQTTKADGTKTESSTTTATPGDSQPPKEDPVVQCDKYPNSLGCAELDTPDAEIPKDTQNVSFTVEDPFGAGRCPADVMASFRAIGGQSLKIVDWTTFCGFALPLRGLVLALAAIMAFFIIMPGGVRE